MREIKETCKFVFVCIIRQQIGNIKQKQKHNTKKYTQTLKADCTVWLRNNKPKEIYGELVRCVCVVKPIQCSAVTCWWRSQCRQSYEARQAVNSLYFVRRFCALSFRSFGRCHCEIPLRKISIVKCDFFFNHFKIYNYLI